MKWCEERGYCWPSDRAYVEETGAFEVVGPQLVRNYCMPACLSSGLLPLLLLLPLARTSSLAGFCRRAQIPAW